MSEIARGAEAKSRRAIIYSNRRMLTRQTSRKLAEAGVDHGVLLSGERSMFAHDVQVASVQTVHSWLKRRLIDLHPGDVVMVDEPHAYRGEMIKSLLEQHVLQEALIIGFTATPVGLSDQYDVLVEAGTKKELRKLGGLVAAKTFAPDEPDLKHIGMEKIHYTTKEQTEVIMRPKIFGRVWDHWTRFQKELLGVKDVRLDARPTVLFAPGVPHARWFAEQFQARGVIAAHIDNTTPDQERADIMGRFEEGNIKLITNRFILREGIDCPVIEHMILACVMGSVQTWIQAVGRGLRASPGTGKRFLIVQDHGGHWHRHGDINDDIEWVLADNESTVNRKRREAVRSGEVKEDICCPRCKVTIKPIDFRRLGCCPNCGKKFKRSCREVVQVDGTLKRMYGPARPMRRKRLPKMDAEKLWDQCFWAALNAKRKMTLQQVRAWFYKERHRRGISGSEPPYGAWNCPEKDSAKWARFVRDEYGKYQRKR